MNSGDGDRSNGGEEVESRKETPGSTLGETQGRRSFLSDMVKSTSKKIEYAVEDVSDFLDLQTTVNEVLKEDQKKERGTGGGEAGKDVVQPGPGKAGKAESVDAHDRGEEGKSTSLIDPSSIMLRDKIAFFIGVLNVALIGFWMGKSPETYYHYWTFKSFVLFSLRWWTYRKKGYQYLMFELCYFGNFLAMIHVYFYPEYNVMRKTVFAVCSGPLMWSILAMRNSLVFHDMDKITTLMMHASPALTAWSLRWYPDLRWTESVADVEEYTTATWYEFVGLPVLFYLMWVIFYYILTFVLLKERIKRQGGVTMFDLLKPKEPKKAKNPLVRTILSAPEATQPLIYLIFHGIAATLSFIPTYYFWQSFHLHTTALLFCLGISVWNGGNYYFKVFANRYTAQLQERSHRGFKKE